MNLLGWTEYEQQLVEKALQGEPLDADQERELVKIGRLSAGRRNAVRSQVEKAVQTMTEEDAAEARAAWASYEEALGELLAVVESIEGRTA